MAAVIVMVIYAECYGAPEAQVMECVMMICPRRLYNPPPFPPLSKYALGYKLDFCAGERSEGKRRRERVLTRDRKCDILLLFKRAGLV